MESFRKEMLCVFDICFEFEKFQCGQHQLAYQTNFLINPNDFSQKGHFLYKGKC